MYALGILLCDVDYCCSYCLSIFVDGCCVQNVLNVRGMKSGQYIGVCNDLDVKIVLCVFIVLFSMGVRECGIFMDVFGV
jgi:hypothetical protein